jgi:hypothetical protein
LKAFLASPLTDSNRRPPPYHQSSGACRGLRAVADPRALPVSAAVSFATGCHWLPPLGSISAPCWSARQRVKPPRKWGLMVRGTPADARARACVPSMVPPCEPCLGPSRLHSALRVRARGGACSKNTTRSADDIAIARGIRRVSLETAAQQGFVPVRTLYAAARFSGVGPLGSTPRIHMTSGAEGTLHAGFPPLLFTRNRASERTACLCLRDAYARDER